MPTDLELMNIHVRVLYTSDVNSRLLFVNEPHKATIPAPRLFLGRTKGGNVWRFNSDLLRELYGELNELCMEEPELNALDEPPRNLEAYLRLLEPRITGQNVSNGISYQFVESELELAAPLVTTTVTEANGHVLEGGFENLIEELATWQPFVALVKDGKAVSVCRSARITPEAHEAGVETLADYRGNGYAETVVREWACLVRKAGPIPLYSTSFENVASQRVARKLGLKCYGIIFEIA